MAETTGNIGLVKPAEGESLDIGVLNHNADLLDEEIFKRAKTLNGEPVDENGGFSLKTVEFARQIVTEDAQESTGEYIVRTTGGEASLSDGDAVLIGIRGRRVRTGYIPEEIDYTVNSSSISAVLNRDTFVAYVLSSGTITLTYSDGAWDADPALYGITVSGTPANGDSIVVTYVKEVLGTITPATPSAFRSTGWNLFDSSTGYARAVKYSEQYGFKIGGSYSLVQFSETLSGTRTTLTPVNGYFMVPANGYIWVSGSSTDTYVMMTWSDWTEGYVGDFQAYTESVIDLTDAMSNFPNGLFQVGGVYDDINFNTGKAYSRIERLANTTSNMAVAKASGRDYEVDENYIYLVRETPVEYSISTDGMFTACDHGLEFFDGTAVAVYAATLYGQNLVDKLRTDVVTISAQELTENQKAQVRENVGLGCVRLSSTMSEAVSAGLISNVSSKLNQASSNASMHIYRFGNVVMMSAYIILSSGSSIAEGDILFTLASGLRPVAAMYLPVFNGSYRLDADKGISINADTGEAKFRTTAAQTQHFRIFGVYMTP